MVRQLARASVPELAEMVIDARVFYGVVACLVVRRSPEIGVRKALGADAAAIMRLVLASGARMVAAGLAIGIVIAASLVRLLGALLLEAGSPR